MHPTNKITTKTNESNYKHTSSTEAKKTSSGSQKAQQVQPSGKNISQDIQNAKAITNVAPEEYRATLERIINLKTHPNELISLANTISDEETQRRAWIIIFNRENTPAHIRLEAAQNIQNDSTRKDLLKILANDSTINICLRLKAAQLIDENIHDIHDNQLYQRLFIEASKEGKSLLDNFILMPEFIRSSQDLEAFEYCSNADELFAIVATHPECSRELRFEATQKIKDQITKQNACYCNILFFKDTNSLLSDKIQWLKCMTDEPFLHVKDLHLRNSLNSDSLKYNSSTKLKLLSLMNDKQFLKEHSWRLIADNSDRIDVRTQAAELLSIEDQPEAFLYICEHGTNLNSSQLEKLFSRIPDESFSKEKQAILKAIINNPKRDISLQVAAVQLMGSPYKDNVFTIIKHPGHDPLGGGAAFHKIRAAKLLSIEDQPEAFLYICEHDTSLSSDELKELFSYIPDEDFSREKQAVLNAIINNPEWNTSLKVAAVQLMGSPYEKNILTIINHPLQYSEHDIKALVEVIKLIEGKNQQEDLIVELLSNFKDAYALIAKLHYTLYEIQDSGLKARILNNFLHGLNDLDCQKCDIPYAIYCVYREAPAAFSAFKWNADLLIKWLQSSTHVANAYFHEIIHCIPEEQRDEILVELFKRVNPLAIQQNAYFDSDSYIRLFQKLYNFSSEDARETLLYAITSNNNLEKDFRIRLITELNLEDNKRKELLKVIKYSHETQGGAIDPKRKYKTKRAS